MTIVKFINNRPARIGGEEHSSWLPPGEVTPLPTSVRDIFLNFEIQFDGNGYLLCHESTDGTVSGDTWHQSLNEAEDTAKDWFEIAISEWKLQ